MELRFVGVAATTLALAAATLTLTSPAEGLNTNRTGRADDRGFPRFYTDDSGLSLQLCEDGTAACLGARPGNLVAPDGEALYWAATATLPTRRGDLDVEFALEAAFGDGGGPVVFDRIRIRGHLDRAGRYILRHPYGTKRFRAARPAEQRNVDVTIDLGCSLNRGGPCQGRIDNWLRSRSPRVGYLGRGEVATRVTGGTKRNELVLRTRRGRIIGQTSRFAVLGKLASGPAAALSRTSVDMGNTARARKRTITIRNLGNRTLDFRRIRVRGDDTFRIRRRLSTCRVRTAVRSGRACRITLRYVPDGRRVSTGRIVIRDDTRARRHRIRLRAATAADLSMRRRMHFTARRVGTQSNIRRVVVENTGVVPMRIRGVFLKGRNDRSFVRRSGDGPLCSKGMRLRPGGACAVYVAFSPRNFGLKRSNLWVRSNALSAPHRVRLNGRGR